MTRTTRAAALALIATVGAWPALDEKLQSYPSIHARETAKIKAGDAKGARYVLVNAFHGLGNREQALLSSFALALATDSALFVSWTPIGCNSNADASQKKCAAASLEDLYANREAVTTLGEIERTARRVLGGANPLTESIEDELPDVRAALNAELRAAFKEDPSSLSADDRARAEQLLARDARKAAKKAARASDSA